LHIRERYIRAWLLEREELNERVHRLEIAMRDARELINALEDRLERATNRRNGLQGGRPVKVPPTDEPAPGDKVALRNHARRLGLMR